MLEELVDVCHIGGSLHQVLQRRPGGREGRLEVLTHLADLCAHITFANNIAMTVTGQLAGNKDSAPPFHDDDVGVKYVTLHDTCGELCGLYIVAWHVFSSVDDEHLVRAETV